MISIGFSNLLFHRLFFLPIVFVISVCLLIGCAGRQRLPGEKRVSLDAKEMLDHLAGQNTTLTQFKGLGTYRLKSPRGVLSGRMGWACIRPDRFRTDILDFGGRPFTTITSNGQWLYVRLKGESEIHKKTAKKATIKRIIGAPVTVKDIVTLLSGRIPIKAYQRAQVASDGEQSLVLILKGKWNRVVEEVYFYKETLSPNRVIIYANSGGPAYEVEIGPSFNKDGHSFFRTLIFSDNQGNKLAMKLEKLWLVDDLPASIFELKNGDLDM